eukprot:6127326-Amphidinium_carterae.1
MDPLACAILGTLYKPPAGQLPTIWEMAWDLAMCGIGSKAAFDGVYQHPSSWILDTACAILACQAGVMSPASKGGYCPNEAAELWDWPPGWTGGHNQEHRFNVIETWMLCAVCLQKWEALAQVAWHCVGSLFTA